MRNRWRVWAAAALIVAGAGRASAEEGLPPEAAQAAAKTAGWSGYRANFVLEAAEEDGNLFVLRGTMLFKKPDQRRLEIQEENAPDLTQLLVSDGKTEWQYYPQEKTAYRIKNPPQPPGPHQPFSEAAEGSVKFLQAQGGLLQFEADPRPAAVEASPVPIKKLRLDIAEEDGILRQMVMLGENGETVLTQRFTDVEVNPSLPASQFRFTVPEGAKVTDVPAPQAQQE